MAPLVFLFITTVLVHTLGRLAKPGLKPWPVAIRCGLVVMFFVTGIAHFIGLRGDLIAMVPPWLPQAALLVTVTGVLEIFGAIGLLLRPTRLWAAAGLGLMLVVMFPANVHLALTGTDLDWTDELIPRSAMQLIFLTAVAAVIIAELRSRRLVRSRTRRRDTTAQE